MSSLSRCYMVWSMAFQRIKGVMNLNDIELLHGKIIYNNQRVHSERIVLTNNCNFNCKYCFQTQKKHVMLSEENSNKRIKLLDLRLSQVDSVKINLFGGEPTLNWSSFFKFTEKFKDDERCHLSTITNGSLLTEERIKYLSEIHNFELELSFDGNEEGNQWRKINNKDTFYLTLNKIELFNKYNLTYLIRATIGKSNLKFLKDSLNLFKSIGIKIVYIQCMSYPNSQELNIEELQYLMSIVNDFKNDQFEIKVFNNQPVSNDKLKKDILTYNKNEIWYITQPNGITYSYLQGKSLGIPDSKAHQLEYDEDLSYSNVLDMLNLNTLEYKKLK